MHKFRGIKTPDNYHNPVPINQSGEDHYSNNQSKFIRAIFHFFSAYLVLPLYDLPILGLSLSAPMMLVIAIPSILKPTKHWYKTYQLWIILPIIIWLCIAMSSAINGVSSFGLNVNARSLTAIIQYLYWMVVFVITVYIASQGENLKTISELLGWSICALAIIRLGEVLLTGNFGKYGTARLLTANAYGMLFSMFSPFLYMLIFQNKGRKKILALWGTFILLVAMLLNGSRGSWISVGLGLGFTLLVLLISNPIKFSGLVVSLIFLAGGLLLLGSVIPQIKDSIQQRFNTLSNLEEDKSVLVREVMIQKGLRLFQENSLFGVGPERFRQETVELDLPKQLSYMGQSAFDTKSSHNSYIQFIAEFGLVGIVPFGLFLSLLLIRGIRASFLGLKVGDVIGLAIFMSFIQMSTHLWVISSITNTTTWYIYGLVAAMIMKEKLKARECV